jgi:hypothetical protein
MKTKAQEDMKLLHYARAMSLKTVCVEFMQVQYITVGEALSLICYNNNVESLSERLSTASSASTSHINL